MVTTKFFQDLLAFFENGHIKNVQNRFLESLSHTEFHEFFNIGGNKYIHFCTIIFLTHFSVLSLISCFLSLTEIEECKIMVFSIKKEERR